MLQADMLLAFGSVMKTEKIQALLFTAYRVGMNSHHLFSVFTMLPGQKIDDQTCQKIRNIKTEVDMKVLVSLSCTMCPDLVIACQRIAAENPNIRAEVFDLQHFEDMKNKYNVMSVPCLVINDDKVSFGKKNINQIIELTDNI